jgi:acyl dehydratase
MSWFFDDLAVGQSFSSGPITMERDRIVAFAREFDPQPMHLGEEEAVGTMAGELIASGWHTAATTMRMLIDGAMPDLGGGAVGAGIESIAWPNPVRPGDALSAVSEIVELRPSRSRPDRGLMKLKTTTTNQNGLVVQVVTAVIMVPRRT